MNLPEGREVTHQGGHGHEFIIVLEGTVDVLVDGEVVATCGAGDFFGETALLEDRPRTATVIAKSGVVVDVMGRGDCSVPLNDHPEISEKVHASMARHHAADEARRGGASSDS